MYPLIKSLLFQMDAEKAHHFATHLFNQGIQFPILKNIIRGTFTMEDSRLHVTQMGLQFKNPVGLAAGFDKNGDYIEAMQTLGFGFLELGTVTPRPQIGNNKPRLFRLPADEAIINRMGFNNKGVDYLVDRLLHYMPQKATIIGGNIGKNKDTPNTEAYRDYVICYQKLYPYVDYFTVNLSSPNTPGLRELQAKEPLKKLLSELMEYRAKQDISKPLLLKIAPDLNDAQLDDLIDVVTEIGIDGLIATNTTIARDGLKTGQQELEDIGNGGLSGKPVFERSTAVLTYLRDQLDSKMTLVGVGGIDSPARALQKFDAGAELIQIYSGMIYQGPMLIKDIKKAYLAKAQ